METRQRRPDVTLLLRQTTGPQSDIDVCDRQGHDHGGRRIRCPKCAWEPGRHDRWVCSCRHVWNTFDTGGVCPACQRQWLETRCPRCRIWSPHLEWYTDESGSPQ